MERSKTMKNRMFLSGAGKAVALAIGVSALAGATDVDARTVRFTTQLPPHNFAVKNVEMFTKCVSEKTNLEFQIFPSAQLYRDKEVPQAVSSGAIEMGMVTTARFAGTIPAMEIFDVPFATGMRGDVVKMIAPGAKVRVLLDDAIAATGARVIWWIDYGRTVFLSKKDKPIRQPSDLKNMKVRVLGRTYGEFVEVNGGAPTLTSGSEQFLAYQRGTVNAGMTGVASVKSRKLYEVMDVTTFTEHAHIEFLSLINEKFWNGLTDNERATMTSCGQEAEKANRENVTKIEQEAIDFLKSKGGEIITLNEEELATWRASGKPVVESYLKHSGELGKKVYEAAQSYLK